MPSATKNDDSISAAEIKALAEAMDCRTQAQLAARLGITQPRVSQILSGAHPVKKGTLMQLIRTLQANHLGKKVDLPTSAKKEEARNVRERKSTRRSRRS